MMMEDLKIIVEMISRLPTLAIWVLVVFYAYKVVIVGSIYGVIRFVTLKLHDYLITKKTKPEETRMIRLEDTFHGVTTSEESMRMLILQLRRIAGKGVSIPSDFIHVQSVAWLREAIDAKIEADKQKASDAKS